MRTCYRLTGYGRTLMRYIPKRLSLWASCRQWRGNLRPTGIKLCGDYTRTFAHRHMSASIKHYPIFLERTRVDGTALRSCDFLALETGSILAARPLGCSGMSQTLHTRPRVYGKLSRAQLLQLVASHPRWTLSDEICLPARELCFGSEQVRSWRVSGLHGCGNLNVYLPKLGGARTTSMLWLKLPLGTNGQLSARVSDD